MGWYGAMGVWGSCQLVGVCDWEGSCGLVAVSM